MIRCKDYEIAAQVLEAAIWESSSEEMIFRFAEFYADIVSHKTKNEIQELSDIVQTTDIRSSKLFHSIEFLICFLKYTCYKNLDDKEKSEALLGRIISVYICALNGPYNSNNLIYIYLQFCSCLLLMFDVFEHLEKWRSLHHVIFKKFLKKNQTDRRRIKKRKLFILTSVFL